MMKLIRMPGCGIAHHCPACNEMHVFYTEMPNANGAFWVWNGSEVLPSFTPSMLITADFAPEDGGKFVCHYFLKAGKLQYLNDCTHTLKGQTVALPDLPIRLGTPMQIAANMLAAEGAQEAKVTGV